MELKIAFLIIVTGISGAFAAPSYSQVTKVSLDMKGTTLEQVMDEIERQSEFYFIFNQKQIDVNRLVDVQAENKLITDILPELFSNTNVNYAVLDRKILLTTEPLEKEIISRESDRELQQKQISGTVTDEKGNPLPGVTVIVKGTAIGSLTDASGKYIISNPPQNAILDFTFIGMAAQEIPSEGLTRLDVVMKEEAIGLDEVVVVGYGTQKKVNLTGAVAQVKVDEILKSRPLSNIALAIQGSIPGLEVTVGSGRPGESVGLRIRGIESINGGDPLVLVDNMPIMNMQDLNPSDIESISVLKDASSSSIFGGRAAFGVILIKTKKGTRNQPIRFNYTNNFAISQPTDIPEKASMIETLAAFESWGNSSYKGLDFNTYRNLLTDYKEDPSKYPSGETYLNGLRYGLAEDWGWKKFIKNGMEQKHNFNFSGGSEKSDYRISFGYANEDGIMITNKDSYQKFNVNAYLSTNLTQKLISTTNIMYKNDKRLKPNLYEYLYWRADVADIATNSGYHTLPDGTKLLVNTPNNVIRVEPPNIDLGDDVKFLEKLEYNVSKGLKVIGEYTFLKSNLNTTSVYTDNIYWDFEAEAVQPISARGYDASTGSVASNYKRYHNNTDYHALNLYASYEQVFSDHKFEFLVGTNQELSKYSGFYVQRINLLSAQTPSLVTATGTITCDESFRDFALSGYFLRINYNYKDKYLFEANARYDGSSKFPKDSRYGLFPSFSAGWILSSETFMKPIENIVNFMKIRGSWGEIGNQNISDYAFFPSMSPRYSTWIDPSTAILYMTISSPSLVSSSFTWETVRNKNIGIDISFLNKRLNTTFDYYNRVTLNMLGAASELPKTLGALAPLNNVADLVSKGWELTLDWRSFHEDYGYSFGINLADDRGYVTKYNNDQGLLSQYYDGYEFGEIWGYETSGYLTVEDFVPGTLDSKLLNGTLKEGIPLWYQVVKPNPGDIRYVDLNGDGKISPGTSTLSDPGDRKIIGNNNRRYQFGITGNCFYKNFDFSFFLQGVGKRDLWMSDKIYWPPTGTSQSLYKFHLDYWTPENTDAFYPRSYQAGGGNTQYNKFTQTKYLSNGAYMMLKNVEIGYTLQEALLEKLSIEYARVFVSVENLLRFDHLPSGIDPEAVKMTGNFIYPFLKKFSVGVNVSF